MNTLPLSYIQPTMQERLSRSATLSQGDVSDAFVVKMLTIMVAKRNSDVRRMVTNDLPSGEHDLVDIGLREESRRKLEDEVLTNLHTRICRVITTRRSHGDGQRRAVSARHRDEVRRENTRRFMRLSISPKKGSRPWTGKERSVHGVGRGARKDELVHRNSPRIAHEQET